MAAPAYKPAASFPEADVIDALKKFWAEETGSSAKLGSPFGAPRKGGGSVFDVRPELDSLRAVEVLLVVEPVIGIELPDSVVKLGGYNSCDEFVDHMASGIRAVFEKHHRQHRR